MNITLTWQCGGTRIEVNWNEKAIYVTSLSRWDRVSKRKVFLGVPKNIKLRRFGKRKKLI